MKQRLLALLQTPGGIFLCVVFLTYAPFCWILLIPGNSDWLKLWPTLPGIIFGELLFRRFYADVWTLRWLAPALSILLSCTVFFLMLQFRTRRLLIGAVALAFFSCLSVFAYLLYLA
jgi:hypothetical protein